MPERILADDALSGSKAESQCGCSKQAEGFNPGSVQDQSAFRHSEECSDEESLALIVKILRFAQNDRINGVFGGVTEGESFDEAKQAWSGQIPVIYIAGFDAELLGPEPSRREFFGFLFFFRRIHIKISEGRCNTIAKTCLRFRR